MATTTKVRKVTAGLNDAGHGTFAFHHKPDANGVQGIADTTTLDPAHIHDSLVHTLALRGVSDVLAVRVQRLENPTASEIRAAYDKLISELHDGTWTPGRSFEAAEPDDMVLALAEVTGQPTHVIQATIDAELDKVQTNVDGSPKRDKAGRVVHVNSKAKLYKAFETEPRVKSALSKILAEKARRMAAEGRKPSDAPTGALALFGAPATAAAAQ